MDARAAERGVAVDLEDTCASFGGGEWTLVRAAEREETSVGDDAAHVSNTSPICRKENDAEHVDVLAAILRLWARLLYFLRSIRHSTMQISITSRRTDEKTAKR